MTYVLIDIEKVGSRKYYIYRSKIGETYRLSSKDIKNNWKGNRFYGVKLDKAGRLVESTGIDKQYRNRIITNKTILTVKDLERAKPKEQNIVVGDRVETYRVYEYGIHTANFNVEHSIYGRFFSADVLVDNSTSFILMPKHINHEFMMLWITERIIPPTRIGIEDNLRRMGLSEYDELAILKFTSGQCLSDAGAYIDFERKTVKSLSKKELRDRQR